MDTKFSELRKNFNHHLTPVGVALSGGLDSAVVLHELCKVNSPDKVHAYSMRWGDGKAAEESNTAQKIAKAYGCHFKAIRFEPKLYRTSLNFCMAFFDRPRWNIWPYMLLTEAHKDGVKDFYVGEGCDELFGYQDRSYIKGWVGQLEYIFPVWQQVASHYRISLHAPFLQIEEALDCPGLPSTLHFYCGRFKQALYDNYRDELKAKVIYPKIIATPHYYKVLNRNKKELLIDATKLWINYNA